MAAAAAREAKRSEGLLKSYKVDGGSVIYKETLVGVNAAGYLVPMSDTSGLEFVGVAFETVDNSAGSDGDLSCRVWTEGEFEFLYAGGDAAQTLVPNLVYAQDDQTVDEDASLTTNDYPVGVIREVVSATKVRVFVSAHLRVAGSVATGDIATGAVTTDKIADDDVTVAKLSTNLKKGYIPLPLSAARIIATNDIAAKNAADGGTVSLDTDPTFKRVNGATDKALRIAWAASSVVEIQWGAIAYPPDLDDTAAIVFNCLAGMAGATDTPVLAVSFFEGVGDTNAGGNTAALSASVAQKTVSVAAGDVGAYPKAFSVGITPGAHTTDALYLNAAWLEYTKKD